MKKKRNIHTIPGSVVFTGKRKTDFVSIQLTQYSESGIQENIISNSDLFTIDLNHKGQIKWLDIRGIHNEELIKEIGQKFSIHPLILEDIADVYQRPKFEEFNQNGFVICHSLDWEIDTLRKESVSIYFGQGFLISFQENPDDLFKPIRDRLMKSHGRIRSMGSDYLAYALLDYLVDKYFLAADILNEKTQVLEDLIIKNPEALNKAAILHLKRNNQRLKRSIYPLRETTMQMLQADPPLIEEKTQIYLKDIRTNIMYLQDMLENNRDIIFGIQDLYISELNFKMNRIIQVLTVVTTIFVPLTFIAGVYGMNFDNMPELHWHYGYFIILGCMLMLAVGAALFIRSKKWLK
ncbi:MAG TPA: magnesium/cobalt transporter CorA [Saprospiraceae bacterium]|nr:magnesium/cobalt transporter CorA [Saprospiraceae bacterium]